MNNQKRFGILFALSMADADHGGRQNEKNFNRERKNEYVSKKSKCK